MSNSIPSPAEYFGGRLDKDTEQYFESNIESDPKFAPSLDDYFGTEQADIPAPDEPINFKSSDDIPNPADYFAQPKDEYQIAREERMARQAEQQAQMQRILKIALANN